jgi:hypothetical protein
MVGEVRALKKASVLLKQECLRKMKELVLVLKADRTERIEWLASETVVTKAPKFKHTPTRRKLETYDRIDTRLEAQLKLNTDKISCELMSETGMQAANLIKQAANEEFAKEMEEMEQIRSRKHAGKEYRALSREDQKIIDDDVDLCIAKEKAKIWREMDNKIATIVSRTKPVKSRQTRRVRVFQFDEVDQLKKGNRVRYKDLLVQIQVDAKTDTDNFEGALRSKIDLDNIGFAKIVARKRKDNQASIKKHNALRIELFVQELNMNLKILLGEKLYEYYTDKHNALIEITNLHDIWNSMANRINLNAFKSVMSVGQALLRVNVEFDILYEDIVDGTDQTTTTWNTFVELMGDFWASVANESMRETFDTRTLLYAAIYYSVRPTRVKKVVKVRTLDLLDEKLTKKLSGLKVKRDKLLHAICALDEEIKTRIVRRLKSKPDKLNRDLVANKKKEDRLELKMCETFSIVLGDNTKLLELLKTKESVKPRKKSLKIPIKPVPDTYCNSFWANSASSPAPKVTYVVKSCNSIHQRSLTNRPI